MYSSKVVEHYYHKVYIHQHSHIKIKPFYKLNKQKHNASAKSNTKSLAYMNLQDSVITRELTETDLVLYKEIIANVNKKSKSSRKKILCKYMAQLQQLKQLPLIKQRTPEWYEARKSRLTASDLNEAIGKSPLRLAKKKAGVLKDNTNYTTIAPLKWGTMFEPMAIRSYSQERENIEVHEFGLIADPDLEHFGASPDGINDMGIMIEIKCPFKREIIDDSIPYKYYMQIQGQLAVCKLEECDYVECDFCTYDTHLRYIEDNNNMTTNHGIIAEYKNKETDEYYYLYSELYLSASDAYANIREQQKGMLSQKEMTFIKFTPWRLKNINVQRVTFSPELWNETVPKINTFWEKVEECKLLPVEETVSKQAQKITFIEEDDDE